MKYIFTFLLIFFTSNSFSQTQSDSCLKKYSYLLVGIKSTNGGHLIYPIGTCFFARKNERLFLITAKHNINGYNSFNLKKTPSEYDTIGVRYYNTATNKISYNSLNIIPLKKYLPNNYFFESPDLCVMELHDTAVEPYLNSIENYIFDTVIEKSIPDSIVLYGFGMKDPLIFSDSTSSMYYSGILADKLHIDPAYPVNDNIYYISEPESIQGMSGSPVFLKYILRSVNTTKEKILFGGLMFGGDHDYKSSYVVAPKVIKEEIIDFLK